jgi:1-deoxy-D-xylulose-5-phosphate reductoisomerase
VLNAANEIAVEAFLNQRIRFDQIHHVNEAALDAVVSVRLETLEDLLGLDARSRDVARTVVARMA